MTIDTQTFSQRSAIAVAALFLSAVGCTGGRSPDVEQAHRHLASLRANPQIAANAPQELSDAETAVQRAQTSWSEKHNRPEAEHLSYLAEKRMEIAEVKTSQQLSDTTAQNLNSNRDRVANSSSIMALNRAETRASLARIEQAQDDANEYSRQLQFRSLQKQLNELKARESAQGLVLTLGDVLFESNRAELKSGATRKLTPLVLFLREHRADMVVIEGHTDNTGTSSLNMELSAARAAAVKNFLLSEGLSPERIEAKGFGELYPLTANKTQSGRLQNRRVEIKVIAGPESN